MSDTTDLTLNSNVECLIFIDTFRGYAAHIEYSEEDGCFIGRVAGIGPILTFHGDSTTEVRHSFQEAVDFYLETCVARGEQPEKPFSGEIMTRIPPELHARAKSMSEAMGVSLDQFVREALERAIRA